MGSPADQTVTKLEKEIITVRTALDKIKTPLDPETFQKHQTELSQIKKNIQEIDPTEKRSNGKPLAGTQKEFLVQISRLEEKLKLLAPQPPSATEIFSVPPKTETQPPSSSAIEPQVPENPPAAIPVESLENPTVTNPIESLENPTVTNPAQSLENPTATNPVEILEATKEQLEPHPSQTEILSESSPVLEENIAPIIAQPESSQPISQTAEAKNISSVENTPALETSASPTTAAVIIPQTSTDEDWDDDAVEMEYHDSGEEDFPTVQEYDDFVNLPQRKSSVTSTTSKMSQGKSPSVASTRSQSPSVESVSSKVSKNSSVKEISDQELIQFLLKEKITDFDDLILAEETADNENADYLGELSERFGSIQKLFTQSVAPLQETEEKFEYLFNKHQDFLFSHALIFAKNSSVYEAFFKPLFLANSKAQLTEIRELINTQHFIETHAQSDIFELIAAKLKFLEFQDSKNKKHALEEFEKQFKDPQSPQIHYFLGLMYKECASSLSKGYHPKALKAFQSVIIKETAHKQLRELAYLEFAQLQNTIMDRAKYLRLAAELGSLAAQSLLKQAFKEKNGQPSPHQGLIAVHFAKLYVKDSTFAIKVLESALSVSSYNKYLPQIHYELAVIHAREGAIDTALSHWENAKKQGFIQAEEEWETYFSLSGLICSLQEIVKSMEEKHGSAQTVQDVIPLARHQQFIDLKKELSELEKFNEEAHLPQEKVKNIIKKLFELKGTILGENKSALSNIYDPRSAVRNMNSALGNSLHEALHRHIPWCAPQEGQRCIQLYLENPKRKPVGHFTELLNTSISNGLSYLGSFVGFGWKFGQSNAAPDTPTTENVIDPTHEAQLRKEAFQEGIMPILLASGTDMENLWYKTVHKDLTDKARERKREQERKEKQDQETREALVQAKEKEKQARKERLARLELPKDSPEQQESIENSENNQGQGSRLRRN